MFRRNFIPIIILFSIGLLLMNPRIVSDGVFSGIKIWGYNMVPYLLPMSILSNMLLQYNFLYILSDKFSFVSKRIFDSKYAFIPLFISFVAGYPSGAMTVNSMAHYKRINEGEANSLIAFTNNCSFQFMAGAVSFSMLGNFMLSSYIIIPHLAGAFLTGILLKNNEYKTPVKVYNSQKNVSFYNAFNSSIYKSVISILSVGGVIVIFSVFSNFFNSYLDIIAIHFSINPLINDIIHALMAGLLEITNGCSIISASGVPLNIKLIIINFLISFSGASIMFQTMAVVNDFNLNIGNYIFYKFIQGILSVLICIGMLVIMT